MSKHAAVWIDHNEAKIFHIDAEKFDEATIKAPHHHLRAEAKSSEKGHPSDQQHFFHQVAQALAGAEEILITGPATAKLELIKHVHKHDHTLEPKIIGVETVDHPTDGQLVAYVRKYFQAADRMKGNAL